MHWLDSAIILNAKLKLVDKAESAVRERLKISWGEIIFIFNLFMHWQDTAVCDRLVALWFFSRGNLILSFEYWSDVMKINEIINYLFSFLIL